MIEITHEEFIQAIYNLKQYDESDINCYLKQIDNNQPDGTSLYQNDDCYASLIDVVCEYVKQLDKHAYSLELANKLLMESIAIEKERQEEEE